jgi:hypothetical protein
VRDAPAPKAQSKIISTHANGAKQRIVGAAKLLRSNGAKAEPRKARPEEALLRRGTPKKPKIYPKMNVKVNF